MISKIFQLKKIFESGGNGMKKIVENSKICYGNGDGVILGDNVLYDIIDNYDNNKFYLICIEIYALDDSGGISADICCCHNVVYPITYGFCYLSGYDSESETNVGALIRTLNVTNKTVLITMEDERELANENGYNVAYVIYEL